MVSKPLRERQRFPHPHTLRHQDGTHGTGPCLIPGFACVHFCYGLVYSPHPLQSRHDGEIARANEKRAMEGARRYTYAAHHIRLGLMRLNAKSTLASIVSS